MSAYDIRSHELILSHAPGVRVELLRDLAENFEELEIQALVASGDCFEMLASDLDRLQGSLEPDSLEHLRLEHTIRILLYLQRHYKITKKFHLG